MVLFQEIGQVKFLSPTRPHMRLYGFCFKNYIHTNKRFSTRKFIRTNLRFFPFQKIKGRALSSSTKKSTGRVYFKCKLYLKNSMKLIKNIFFWGGGVNPVIFVTRIPANKSITFFGPIRKLDVMYFIALFH